MTKNLSLKTEVSRQKKERGRKWKIVGWADKAQPPEALNIFLRATLAAFEYSLNLNGIYAESVAGSLCIIIAVCNNCGFVPIRMN